MKEICDGGDRKKSEKACADSWKAANGGATQISRGKSDTGLVACVYRHDIALKMVNLYQSGEKFASSAPLSNRLQCLTLDFDEAGATTAYRCCNIFRTNSLPTIHSECCMMLRVFGRLHAIERYPSRSVSEIEVCHERVSCFCSSMALPARVQPAPDSALWVDGWGGMRTRWSQLRSLIPINCPVSASHRRVNISRRMDLMNKNGVDSLGRWLRRRLLNAQDQLGRAQTDLSDILAMWSESNLLAKWDLQRAAQAATTAGQRRENEDKERLELFNIVQRLHHMEERLYVRRVKLD